MIPLDSSKGVFIGQSTVTHLLDGTSIERHRQSTGNNLSVSTSIEGQEIIGNTGPPDFELIYQSLGEIDVSNETLIFEGPIISNIIFFEAELVDQWAKLCAPGVGSITIHEREAEGERVLVPPGGDTSVTNFARTLWDTLVFESAPLVDAELEFTITLDAGVNGVIYHWKGLENNFSNYVGTGEFSEDYINSGSPVGWQ
jgi:hypothetical protein